MHLRPRSLAFTLLIAALAALPPLSIDMSLPATSAIGASLVATPSRTGLNLSLFMAGFALAQLGFGPVSDRFGRRVPLIATLTLFTISGLFCAFAGAIAPLLIGRFVQGAGAGGATVLAFAIVRDLFHGDEARSRMATIAATMTVAPMLAPSLGAIVLDLAGWRAIFLILGLAGAAQVLVVAAGLGESLLETDARALAPGRLWSNCARVFRHRSGFGHALLGALSFGSLFSFVSGSPLVFIGVLGLGAGAFAALFATCALGLTAGSLLCGRLLRRGFDSRRLLAGAVVGQTLCSAALLALAVGGRFFVADALPLLVINNIAMGAINPLAVHGAMEPFADMAGVASAVRGCLQMLGGAAASALVAWLFEGAPTALPLAMTIFALASLAVWFARVR